MTEKRVAVFIRHSEDEDPVDSTFRHDPKLNARGKFLIDRVMADMIEQYGLPRKIYTSPMYRAVETASRLKKVLRKRYECKVRVEVNHSLNRCFARDERGTSEVRDARINTYEDSRQFHKRVDKETTKHIKRQRKGCVWYVSHYLVIRRLAKTFKFVYPKEHMPPMWHVSVLLGM